MSQNNQDTIQQIQVKKINEIPLHVNLALLNLGITEEPLGSNKGDSIEIWLKLSGVNFPAPWCGSFVGAKLLYGGAHPYLLSARARNYIIKGFAYTLSDVIYGNYKIKSGDLRVKSRKGGGHVDIFLAWNKDKEEGFVIGGNVSDKVSIRKVTLRSMIADRTTHIINIKGIYYY